MERRLINLCLFILLVSSTLSASAQNVSFTHYHTEVFHYHKAKIIFKGNALARMYRTAIVKTYYIKNKTLYRHATGLNFAGHYCFVWWGCGSECQNSAVVDLKTGIVYPGITASLSYDFKKNSRLIIVNPGETIDYCAFCKPEYWVWSERQKKFKQI